MGEDGSWRGYGALAIPLYMERGGETILPTLWVGEANRFTHILVNPMIPISDTAKACPGSTVAIECSSEVGSLLTPAVDKEVHAVHVYWQSLVSRLITFIIVPLVDEHLT